MVVEIIQPDLPPGDDLGSRCQLRHFFEIGIPSQLGFVRMNTDRRINKIVLFGKSNGTVERTWAGAAADSENRLDPSFTGARDDLFTVSLELFRLKMRVGIDEDRSLIVGHWSCRDGRLADMRVEPLALFQSRPDRHIF